MSIRVAVMSALMAVSCVASAEGEKQCEANYKKTGSFSAGQQFGTWESISDVTPELAFDRIYLKGTKGGLRVTKSDKAIGIIDFDQANAGTDLHGKVVSVLWNVIIVPNGKGSKISVTKTVPAEYATSKSFQMQSMCQAIESARNGP